MAIINRHEKCVGFTIFKYGQLRVEVWYCPSGYQIAEHSHPHEDIELMYIFGSTAFYRRDLNTGNVERADVGWRYWLHKFSVKAFHSHWFSVGRWPLIFINFQRFKKGYTPVSAARDFKLTKEV